ncbi:hypothetical protein FHG64_18740 [Antarcticibacterium flavum]|uniref:Uncharacterized protein n=1 Tax=Antarcticibacterium flavum TaxID=2058175 RepID=A0A5B7X6Z6_9FLAO|nr:MULTISPECIES: hypothetical protein [Antarcticibacterium]MCM4160356.1 hypothetical protein [Antarcticibacterium sp. W02-3]QCY71266.1 hypothetical protein FHG64_18740 [Antarcticibacterium flavum]
MKTTVSTKQKFSARVPRESIWKKLTKTKYNDQVLKVTIRTFASALVAVAGFMLFADKILEVNFAETYGFADSQTFLWVFTQSISPLLLIIGLVFKPYKIAITIPVYMYFVQLYWVFNPAIRFDDILLQTYAIGAVLGFIALVVVINWFFHKASDKRQRTIGQLERALDLDLIEGIQVLIRFIVVDIKRKYITEENRKEYVRDYMAKLDKIDQC